MRGRTWSGARNEIAAKVKELFYTMLALQARRRAADAAIAAAAERLKEGRDAVETGTVLPLRAMQAGRHRWRRGRAS